MTSTLVDRAIDEELIGARQIGQEFRGGEVRRRDETRSAKRVVTVCRDWVFEDPTTDRAKKIMSWIGDKEVGLKSHLIWLQDSKLSFSIGEWCLEMLTRGS